MVANGKEAGVRVGVPYLPCRDPAKRDCAPDHLSRGLGGIPVFLPPTSVDCARRWDNTDDSDQPLSSRCSQMDEGVTSLSGDWGL